jgi:hypothetical protein
VPGHDRPVTTSCRYRWRAPFTEAAALALSAAALTTALAGPATAAVPNFPDHGPVDHTSITNSSNKEDTASCGSQYVLGAGMLAGGGVNTRYDDLVPSDHDVNSYDFEDDSRRGHGPRASSGRATSTSAKGSSRSS